jgi:uncharacterized membrane protein
MVFPAPSSAVSIALQFREMAKGSAFLGQRTQLMRFDKTTEAVTDAIYQKRNPLVLVQPGL